MVKRKDPLWKTVLKLTTGAIAIALLVWLVLWYFAQAMKDQPLSVDKKVKSGPVSDWGIVSDSPLRR
ncbi:hypothetical protein KIK84_13510 [Curvibacter sp. CHRR-16]|uniref:hypothetical protein n=1 Tax=Curvibacter sp. CHRR-16 TaxID=2835872 RepID=UPI001BD96F62|nr:hypothetical protein [Curvibacter sp. CHRR-16]MBT0571346.1 hypothetical protein [Curvibacter sp. CHRR-16]